MRPACIRAPTGSRAAYAIASYLTAKLVADKIRTPTDADAYWARVHFADAKNRTAFIKKPEKYVGKRYDSLVLGLMKERQMLALGLYRDKDAKESPLSYVLTNPGAATLVTAADQVYVLVTVEADAAAAEALGYAGLELVLLA